MTVIAWFFSGCIYEADTITRTYRLINGTEKEVRVVFYRIYRSGNDDPALSRTPLIKRGTGLIFEIEAESDFGDPDIDLDWHAYRSDSAIVIFNSLRKITYNYRIRRETYDPDQGDTIISYFTYPIDRNIFLNDAYEVINNGLYEFTFTEEDYSNADSLTAEERKELDRLYETYRYKDPWWD